MSTPPDQKPNEGDRGGLTPLQLGLAMGGAAVAWIVADFLFKVLR